MLAAFMFRDELYMLNIPSDSFPSRLLDHVSNITAVQHPLVLQYTHGTGEEEGMYPCCSFCREGFGNLIMQERWPTWTSPEREEHYASNDSVHDMECQSMTAAHVDDVLLTSIALLHA